jgi:hypothetical protein
MCQWKGARGSREGNAAVYDVVKSKETGVKTI